MDTPNILSQTIIATYSVSDSQSIEDPSFNSNHSLAPDRSKIIKIP